MLAAVAMGVVLERRSLAERALVAELAARGLAPASLRVAQLDLTRLVIADLRVGREGELEVGSIAASYSPRRLLAGRLDALRISGLRVRGRYADARLHLGALDPLLRSDSGEEAARGVPGVRAAAPAALLAPAAQIVLEDARIELATPDGPATASVSADIGEDAEGRVAARAELAARGPAFAAKAGLELAGRPEALEGALSLELEPGEGAAPLSLVAQLALRDGVLTLVAPSTAFSLTLSGGDDSYRVEGETPGVHIEGSRVVLRGGRVRVPFRRLEARDVDLEATLDPVTGLPSGRLKIARLRDLQDPPQLPALALEGTFESRPPGLAFDLRLADPSGMLVLGATGAYDLDAAAGQAALRLEPLVFARGGLQPPALLPALRGVMESATGSIEAHGEVSWWDAATAGGVDVAVRDLSFSGELGELQRLNAAIHFESLWPPATAAKQLVSLARLDVGIELTNGLATYRLNPDGTLDLESARFDFAGGSIRTAGSLRPSAVANRVELEVTGVDLGALLELVNLDGLSGEGVLAGRIPVLVGSDAIEIQKGALAAQGPGRIRYAPKAGLADAAAAPYGLDVLLLALENFEYDRLDIEVDGNANGVVDVALHLGGSNPGYQKGRRVELNVDIESRLADLLRKGVAAYRVPQVIQERLEALSRRHRESGASRKLPSPAIELGKPPG